jgi:hypothetical protein
LRAYSDIGGKSGSANSKFDAANTAARIIYNGWSGYCSNCAL